MNNILVYSNYVPNTAWDTPTPEIPLGTPGLHKALIQPTLAGNVGINEVGAQGSWRPRFLHLKDSVMPYVPMHWERTQNMVKSWSLLETGPLLLKPQLLTKPLTVALSVVLSTLAQEPQILTLAPSSSPTRPPVSTSRWPPILDSGLCLQHLHYLPSSLGALPSFQEPPPGTSSE